MRLTGNEIDDIWERMLDAQADVLFWGRMLRTRRTTDLWMTIFILVFSLGPVLSLRYFVQHPAQLQAALAMIAVLAIAQAILSPSSAVNEMVGVHGECVALYTRYDLLWGDLEYLPPDQAREEFRQLKMKTAKIATLCVRLPRSLQSA